ncbi:stage II sporulation protein R [Rossellomorea marisflavi]|jgi:stage II sporulation protein R|uniref:stage II sporulation protein R n=1 Tax=Rossellomorea marisflavi TaxID=189381 RepID=UPI002852FE9D|nr:stage II sporulation protein R [Rossellomorea marisflavi]MDR4935164.1 stage II sporulation protein R [Rossellomorea marisflavi]
MKTKQLVLSYLLILSVGTILSLYIPKQEAVTSAQETVMIPEDAIRLRILANSDRDEDQDVKRLVRDEVNKEITSWVSELQDKEEAKSVIKEGLPQLKEIAQDVLKEEGVSQSVAIEFGKVDFPTKLYGQFLYPAGEYEAVLITLGKGEGANWWCVLYPPLCFLDFSTGNAVSSQGFETKVEASGKEVTTADDRAMEETGVKQDTMPEADAQADEQEASPASEPEEKATPNGDKDAIVEKPAVKAEQPLTEEIQTDAAQMNVSDAEETQIQPVFAEEEEEEVEVRFFIVDMVKGLFQ